MNVEPQARAGHPRPLTSVDVVLFTAIGDRLHVLLVQRPDAAREPYPGRWALPGGFVRVDQDPTLEACARRTLQEKTGVVTPYLEQLGSWGGASRDPRGWSATHVYFALLPHASVDLRAGGNAAATAWLPVAADGVAVDLAFDHAEILRTALQRLRGKAEYTSLPVYLLEDVFTLPELQQAYETVLGRPVDKSAFRTRIMAADMLVPVAQTKLGAHRPAQMYRLRTPGELVLFPRTFSPRG